MSTKKHKHSENDTPLPEGSNPANSGTDHNVSEGTEKDLKHTYIQKQESSNSRGIDNEDSTEALEKE